MKLYQIFIVVVAAQRSNQFEPMFVQHTPSVRGQYPSLEYQIGKWLAESGTIDGPGKAFAAQLLHAMKPYRYQRINATQKRRLGLYLKQG